MDPISHAALGASCSQALLGKYQKHIPWQIGALAAMAPDLDIFIQFKDDPLGIMFWHRNFTHSLLFIPVGGILVGLFFMCFLRYRTHWKITMAAALIGYSTHGFLDAMTSYGTVLFWPWSYSRSSWDIIAIINPLFTIPLVLCLAWSVIYQKPKVALWGLLFVGSLLSWKFVQHRQVLEHIKKFAQYHKLPLTKIRAIPQIASPIWDIIAQDNKCLLLAQAKVSLLNVSPIIPVAKLPLYSQDNQQASFNPTQQRDLALFFWFSDDYVVVAKQSPLILADGRFTFTNKPLRALWGIKLIPEEKHAINLRYIPLNEVCDENGSGRYMNSKSKTSN